MQIESVTLAYFSPTGTSKAVAQAIARGLRPGLLEEVDLTSPVARTRPLGLTDRELLVMAVPVYMGRAPDLLGQWLESLQGRDTPAVCVVVYGNRAYENALLELKDVLGAHGCVPVAGAAFIGEHAFSTHSGQVAWGRPDEADLTEAEIFGKRVRAKLDALDFLPDPAELKVPGSRPYGGITTLWDVDFIEVSEACMQCGHCADICPMRAIDPQDSANIDQIKCISCCACIKHCPQQARSIKPSPVQEAVGRLNSLYAEPKQPETFL